MNDTGVFRASSLLATAGLILCGCPQKQRVVAGPGAEHCGSITGAETWRAADGVHRVTCDVQIEDAGVLTIEAGARVTFAESTGLYVAPSGRGGTLHVQGTERNPVLMEPTAPPATDPPMPYAESRGQWRGIMVARSATDVRLVGLQMEGAGGRGVDASINLEDTTVLIDHVTIRRSEGCGLKLWEPARLSETSTALVVSDSEWPACVAIVNAHTLPATESDYTGNDTDRVRVEGGTIATSVTWEDLGVPYEMQGSIAVQGEAPDTATLTLDAGTTVLFPLARGLNVEATGGLSTAGSADRPVLLGPAIDNGRGSWIGMGISAGAQTARLELRGLVIENAGFVPYPVVPGSALHVDGAAPLIDGVTLRGADDYGFRFTGLAGFAQGSRGLVVTDSEGVGILDAATAHTFPETDARLTGNDTDAVEVEHGSVHDAVTWGDPGVPYLVRGTIFFDGTDEAPAVLTVEPGTTIENTGGGLSFSAYQGAAGLMAVGTAERPIVFTGRRAGVETQGYWDGIGFSDHVVDGRCRLEHVELGFGGGNPWSSAALGLTGASPTLTSMLIHDSSSWGLALDRDSMPAMTDVRFANNASGDISMR